MHEQEWFRFPNRFRIFSLDKWILLCLKQGCGSGLWFFGVFSLRIRVRIVIFFKAGSTIRRLTKSFHLISWSVGTHQQTLHLRVVWVTSRLPLPLWNQITEKWFHENILVKLSVWSSWIQESWTRIRIVIFLKSQSFAIFKCALPQLFAIIRNYPHFC